MGWNQPSNNSTARTKKKRSRVFVSSLCLAGVVAVVFLCFWFLRGSTTKTDTAEEIKNTPVKRGSRAVKSVSKGKVVIHKASEENELKWNDNFVTNRELRIKFSVLAEVRTNSSGVITERYRMPNGKYWRRQIDPPPIFSNPSDNAIAMALGDRSGAPIPPYPGLNDIDLDKQFAQSLATPIEIDENDKPWVVALKVAVQETRKEIAALIKAGDTRSVGEILLDHVHENNRTAELHGEAWQGYHKILKEDGEEAANEYLTKVNDHLERYGVAPLKHGEKRRKEK